MYNSDYNGVGGGAPMSPRISFSNDFVEAHSQGNIIRQERCNRDTPISTDFEFSVSGYSMMTADELFSKGRLLPLKQRAGSSNATANGSTTTLRDELLVEDDGNDSGRGFALKPPKGANRWKSFLGLRKSHIGSKKQEKNDGFAMGRSSAAEPKRYACPFDQLQNVRKSAKDMMMSDEGSNDSDMEI